MIFESFIDNDQETTYDTIIIGAGPAGLAVANRLQKENINYLVVEKNFAGYNISRFPVCMTFFSGRALLEIDDFAMTIPDDKPTREQYLSYLFHFVRKRKIKIRDRTEVVSVVKTQVNDKSLFEITIRKRNNATQKLSARSIVCACGALDQPRLMNVEGENLPHVSHYFSEVYRFAGHKVLIVGSGNSAVEAALKLYRAGAKVNLSYRQKSLNAERIKYWLYPDIDKRFLKNEIGNLHSTTVKKIEWNKVVLQKNVDETSGKDREDIEIETDFVLALTGYNPPVAFLRSMNIEIDEKNHVPVHNPETLETNIKGLFIAGVIIGGNISGKVFIENSRQHGDMIITRIHEIIKEG